MGGVCCCPCQVDDFEEYTSTSTNSSIPSFFTHCLCLRFLFHHFLAAGYGTMFHRLDGRSLPPTQAAPSGSPDTSQTEPNLSLSRPVPYDADQRYIRMQRDGLVSRKAMMVHSQEDSQPPRRNTAMESLRFGNKWNGVDSEDDNKLGHSESSDKPLATKFACGLAYAQPSPEDEDVCPTCLDEYTPENPKITARCSHHFHLGCIYEWLERSEHCPICGKEMEFCESP